MIEDQLWLIGREAAVRYHVLFEGLAKDSYGMVVGYKFKELSTESTFIVENISEIPGHVRADRKNT